MIKIFVGCAANDDDAESQAVLEWSLMKHASEPLEITWMKLSRDSESPFYCDPIGREGWRTELWATPFSGFRWAVPELCNFKGKAIYMDSDVIVLKDIAELWRQEFAPTKIVMAKGKTASWRYCVSFWDCERAKFHMMPLADLVRNPESHRSMVRLFRTHSNLVQPFHGNWNCLDGEDYDNLDDPEIKLIHYTAMRFQPQLRHARSRLAAEGRAHWFDGAPAVHWRADLIAMFDALLVEAGERGYPISKYCGDPLFGSYKKRSVAGVGTPSWVPPARLSGRGSAA